MKYIVTPLIYKDLKFCLIACELQRVIALLISHNLIPFFKFWTRISKSPHVTIVPAGVKNNHLLIYHFGQDHGKISELFFEKISQDQKWALSLYFSSAPYLKTVTNWDGPQC